MFDRALELRPAYVDAHVAAGVLAARMGKREKAIEHWEQALTFDLGNAVALHNLAVARAAAPAE